MPSNCDAKRSIFSRDNGQIWCAFIKSDWTSRINNRLLLSHQFKYEIHLKFISSQKRTSSQLPVFVACFFFVFTLIVLVHTISMWQKWWFFFRNENRDLSAQCDYWNNGLMNISWRGICSNDWWINKHTHAKTPFIPFITHRAGLLLLPATLAKGTHTHNISTHSRTHSTFFFSCVSSLLSISIFSIHTSSFLTRQPFRTKAHSFTHRFC